MGCVMFRFPRHKMPLACTGPRTSLAYGPCLINMGPIHTAHSRRAAHAHTRGSSAALQHTATAPTRMAHGRITCHTGLNTSCSLRRRANASACLLQTRAGAHSHPQAPIHTHRPNAMTGALHAGRRNGGRPNAVRFVERGPRLFFL
jgi:hypothetical protein